MPKSSYGEYQIKRYLERNHINYIAQFQVKDSPISRSKYDFYIPTCNTLVEFDGRQHFKRSRRWHRKKGSWAASRARDVAKSKYAVEYGYRLLRISHIELRAIDLILSRWCANPKLFRFTNGRLYRPHILSLISQSTIFKSKLQGKYPWAT